MKIEYNEKNKVKKKMEKKNEKKNKNKKKYSITQRTQQVLTSDWFNEIKIFKY